MNPVLQELIVRARLNGWSLRDVPIAERPNGGEPWRYELTIPGADLPIRFRTKRHLMMGLGCLEQNGELHLGGATSAYVKRREINGFTEYKSVGNRFKACMNIKFPKELAKKKK